MWKWLAGFSVAYGLLSVALLLGPGQALTSLDLNRQRLNMHTDPASRYEIIDTDAAKFVRWFPGLGPEEMHLIAMPLKSPPGAKGIRIVLRASQPTSVLVGIREANDAIYLAKVTTDQNWHENKLPLDDFRLSPRSNDPNGQLDLEEIRGVLIILPPQGEAARQRWGEHLRNRPGGEKRARDGLGGSGPRKPGNPPPNGLGPNGRRPGELQRGEQRRPDGQGRPQPSGERHPGEFEQPPGEGAQPPPQLYVDIQVLEFVPSEPAKAN